ncbi:hypothetical protein SacmaDRAFT_5246 [Saccharomonospora marina XMU15]|uniref:Uncharacterized protein n=1 Tax=Saccharomonospora marina XMU15 TaxID=882083 RepID=H5X608_9PSEU|nr:hypothetical protein [Saccharomonospora marina]EHR53407.1 hypothetical protein SacmaDRAFT_5246 [Saccharomonospora marina XMU15]
MHTNVVPLGERILRSVLDHVVANGDAAETSYLEGKSAVGITSKPGPANVAKFLLACANRLLEDAARHFKGYAVLVIGATGRGGSPSLAARIATSSRRGCARTQVRRLPASSSAGSMEGDQAWADCVFILTPSGPTLAS